MTEPELRVLLVVGSLRRASATRVVLHQARELLRAAGCEVDFWDLATEPLGLYNPDTVAGQAGFAALRLRVVRADAYLLGTPDYHGSVSGPLKNFLDHFWHEFTGKLMATLVASHEKGLTVTDQLRTVARQCYAWSLPYGLSFVDGQDVRAGRIIEPKLEARLAMLVRDVRVYGGLLARQRQMDLARDEVGFMAARRGG